MRPIKRTANANRPRAAVYIEYPWGQEGGHYADTVHVEEYPTHSPVLGPDGLPLQYEARMALGFDLRERA